MDYDNLSEYNSDSAIETRKRIRRSVENLMMKNPIKPKVNSPVGDGIQHDKKMNPIITPMKIRDELKMDLRVVESLSGLSDRSRFKLYTIDEVSETSNSLHSLHERQRQEERDRIAEIIAHQQRARYNRPKASFQKHTPPHVVELHRRAQNKQSVESIIEPPFDIETKDNAFNGNPEETMKVKLAADTKTKVAFDSQTKLVRTTSSVDSILSYKRSQVERLCNSSSYEYQKRMMQKNKCTNKGSSTDLLSITRTVSSISTFSSCEKSTSCFSKICGSFRNSKRQK